MAAAKASRSSGTCKPHRKISKNVTNGHAYIRSTFNSTIVSLTDPTGVTVAWTSSGQAGPKDLCKSTLFAAQFAAEATVRRAQEHGMKKVDVSARGPGSGREIAIRSFQAAGLEIGSIQDATSQTFNGIRSPKRRRG